MSRARARQIAAAAWAVSDARDVAWFGGLGLFAFAPTWRLAVVGVVPALHAAVGGALIARMTRPRDGGAT